MAQQTAQLCDYCHQKPQHQSHKYCSKYCAGQASAAGSNSGANSNLCTQCQKKPKFQNFGFCGKTCASQAIAQRQASGQHSKGTNAAPQQPAQAGINPIQMAQLIAQQVPQVQALLAAVNGPGAAAPPGQVIPAAGVPQNNPFLQQSQVPVATNGTLAAYPQSPPAAQQPLAASQPLAAPVSFECFIPGCKKPVHTDAKGLTTSEYCSKRHREEAVTSGLVDPCILCLKFPQGDKDYFCSRMCREEALEKMPQ